MNRKRKLWSVESRVTHDDHDDLKKKLTLRFQKDIDPTIRTLYMDFARWIRKNYCFPKSISVFFYNEETVKTSSGDYVSAFFWGPYDRMEKPYIKIATGDYNRVLREYDGNNSTTMIRFLQTMAHELSHYYQWLQSDWEEKSNQQIEKQARYYAKAVVYDYIHDSNPNYLKEKHEHYLNKNEILSILKDAEGSYEMLRFYFCYDQEFLEFKKFYVASYSEEFIFGIKEDDFILNGFQIRKLSDLKSVEVIDDLCVKINKKQGILDRIQIPIVDLTSWKSICESLLKWKGFVCIENEITNDGEDFLFIGELKSVESDYLVLQPIDADGFWEDEILIYYEGITCFTFGDRYTSVWSDYINNRKCTNMT